MNNEYKLINKTTREETICTKVVVDGFDYYEPIVKTKPSLNDYYIVALYDVEMNETIVFEKVKSINEIWINNESVETSRHIKNCRKILATNNPSIDIGQVIDEDSIDFSLEIQGYFEDDTFNRTKPVNEIRIIDYNNGLVEGYNIHAQTHKLSDDEVLEFVKFVNKKDYENGYGLIDREKLLQLFKEQLPKIIYYE